MRTASIYETAELDLTRRAADSRHSETERRIYDRGAFILRLLNDAESYEDVVRAMIELTTRLEGKL